MRVHIHCLSHPLVESVHGAGRCRVRGPGPTIASVVGDVDARGISILREGLSEAIRGANRTVIVDLSQADFVSISGMQALVEAQVCAELRGLAMLLVPDGRSSRRVLEVTNAEDRFRCFPSVRAAVAARRTELAAHVDLDHVLVRSRRDEDI